MEQQQQSRQTFPQDILDGIKQSILSNVPADDWQTEHRLKHNIFTDVEVQPLIAAVSNNFSDDFFHTNRSTLSLGELKLRFCKLFASVRVQENPKMLGGNRGNDAMMDVARGIHQKKVNLRSIPYGWNRDRREWNHRTRRFRGQWRLTSTERIALSGCGDRGHHAIEFSICMA